jgi:hypothetical protein
MQFSPYYISTFCLKVKTNILSRDSDYRQGFGSATGFTELLQLVIMSKDYAFTVLHTSQITIGHIRSFQSVRVFTSHCLVVASNGRCSPSSGFPDCPQPQLPTSFSKQQLTLTEHQQLTNSLTPH